VEAKFEELKARLAEVNDLESAAALLSWDQTTYMPPGGAEARGRQLATLGRLAHEKFTDDVIGKLLDDLRPYEESRPYDSFEASLIRVARRDYERAVKVPAAFMAEIYGHTTAAYEAWTKARAANDFAAMRPLLEKTLDLSHNFAEFFPDREHIIDPLIDLSDYGMKAASVRALFADLRAELVPIVQAITERPPADDACLKRHYPEDQQRAFGEMVIQRYGYDFNRGRQDKTHHPFMTKFSLGDVRITTRFNERDLGDGLFSTLHEAGHALYEQGIRAEFEGTPLAGGTSSGAHESQSRMWENIVGRSRGFWEHFYPQLQQTFPQQLGDVSLDTFYRAINKVQRSLIRVDADEVTYNLHVMMRFDFELALLEGQLPIRDLPDAWHERMQSDLGIAPPDDRDGVLQDVHWFGGLIGGAFQGYTIGNILSAQFFESATRAHPSIEGEIARGEFGTLHGWLKQNVYQYGRVYTAPELVERATGGPLSFAPYIRYLREKYGELYQL
jgi:carboxypeptidase Taq